MGKDPEVCCYMKSLPEILIYSPSVGGGIAEYTLNQAKALERAGARVTCLVSPSFLAGRQTGLRLIICLADPVVPDGSRVFRKARMAWRLIANQLKLAWQNWRHRPDLVLFDSYVEYLSPFWAWPHWLLAGIFGIRYAANLHDPVRNYVIGPGWWHKWSVRLAYLPLDFVLVHDRLQEPSPVPPHVRVVQVPHGLYTFGNLSISVQEIRRQWGVKEEKIFLAFGYVRDGKNLDLAVRALVHVPNAFLVMAGSVASGKDKPFAYYRELAEKMGVLHRCHFEEGFVADEDLGRYFSGADFVLLTYSSTFHSQSGVLNIAARARKPMLASASPGPLVESVRKFQLGVVVEPDSPAAVVSGMQHLLANPASPQWDDYEKSASWAANAQRILRAAGLDVESQP
jgi:glycosyltransferase involved in cell wall biosynthesis